MPVQHHNLDTARIGPRRDPLKPAGRSHAPLALAVALAASLGGCSLTPAYHRPSIAPVGAWDTQAAQPALQGEPPATVRSDWWRHFASPELDRLMERSLSDSFTLQAAVARVRQAEGSARIVAAPLAPSLSLSGTAGASSGSTSSPTRNVLAQASYELDFWGKNRAAAGSGVALARASAFDAGTVAMTLSASVADEYFTVLSLRERLGIARQQADDARKVLALIQAQRSAGTATDLQLRQQETSIAGLDAAVPALVQQLKVAQDALAVLTGRPPEGFTVEGASLDDVLRPAISPDLPPQLMALRPDVQAAEARLVSANFDIGAARAAFFPSLSLSASGGLRAAGAGSIFPPVAIADAAAGLLAPLFDGGRLGGQLKVSRARQVELVATYRQTVLTAYQEVEDALGAIANARAQEALQEGGATSAQHAAALAMTQYRLGSADYLSVLTTQQTLYQARDSLAQTRLTHLEAIVSLCRALGGGFGRADLQFAAAPTSRSAPLQSQEKSR